MENENDTKKEIEFNNLMNRLNKIDFNDNKSIINFINDIDFDVELTSGLNSDGETIVISAQKGEFLRISTYQNNGFIRVNIYTLDGTDIIKEELYEPSGN